MLRGLCAFSHECGRQGMQLPDQFVVRARNSGRRRLPSAFPACRCATSSRPNSVYGFVHGADALEFVKPRIVLMPLSDVPTDETTLVSAQRRRGRIGAR